MNLTRLCSFGTLRKALIFDWKGVSVLTSLYFRRILWRAILTSIKDICCPIQFLGPPEKGIKASGFYSGLLNRSGSNSKGLSKYLILVMQIPKPSRNGIPFLNWNPFSSNGCCTFLIKENLTGPISRIASFMKLFRSLLL